MIAGCPTCGARYRIDTAKLPVEGARLRCSRCEGVFRVRPPEIGGATTQPKPFDLTDPEKRVLVAHPEPEAGKALADALVRWGLSPLLVHDGVEAILQIQRCLPRAVVLDAALTKMFGFQVCELMKRNEQLRSIPVVLVGAIHDRDRYRRAPSDLYGADAYTERHELPEALAGHFLRFGLELSESRSEADSPARPAFQPAAPISPITAPPASEAASEPSLAPVQPPASPSPIAPLEPAPPSAPPPAPLEQAPPPAPAPAAPGPVDPEVEKAERLARIIVSDVILYNPEKFEAGVQGGDVVERLAGELEEGYALFAQRVDSSVYEPREFLQRELVRVAKSRGMN